MRVSMTLALLLLPLVAGCDPECRRDTDCPNPDGIQRCDVENGTCVPLQVEPPQSCEVDDNCLGGRNCVAGECVFRPQCQRFSGTVEVALRCGTDVSEVSASLNTEPNCDSQLSIDGIGPLSIGNVPSAAPVVLSDVCNGGVFDVATGSLGLSECDLPNLGQCDVAAVVRDSAQACIVGDPACAAPLACAEVFASAQLDFRVGECQ